MSCFPLVIDRNFRQSLQRSREQRCCVMDILNKPINPGPHHAALVEPWLNFFLPSPCFTANVLPLHFHLRAVLSPPVMMAQWWQLTPCLSGGGLRPFSDIASPVSIRVPTQFYIPKCDWQGRTRDFISLLSTPRTIGWCKLAMAPLKSGELQQLHRTSWSVPPSSV